MTIQSTRREILVGGLAAAGLGVLGIPEWALPALAQGETEVAFTDIPDNVRWEVPPDRRKGRQEVVDRQRAEPHDEGDQSDEFDEGGFGARPGERRVEDLGHGRLWRRRKRLPETMAGFRGQAIEHHGRGESVTDDPPKGSKDRMDPTNSADGRGVV